jgi:transposase
MKKPVAARILRQWAREDPPRLLQSALQQARRIEELLEQTQHLRAENAFLREQLVAKNERIGALESALEDAARTAHRQAAPFRIREEKRVIAPKRLGRKQGHPGAFRPKPDRIDEEITVELRVCPCCGGTQFKDQSEIERVIEEIPPIVPKITRLRTYQATCVCCSQEVRSSHPLQMSLATGAAGVQLGPHALAIAADLNKAEGLSMRKTCAVLADCFGLGSSAGGLGKNCSPKVGPPGDLYLDIPISPAMMPTTALHPVFYALQLGAYPFRS